MIHATLDYLMAAFERYTYRHRPPGVKKVLFVRRPVTYDFDRDSRLQTATIYDASIPTNLVPIVEVWAQEVYATCTVRVRCYESRFEDWYEGLIGRPPKVSTNEEPAGTPGSGKPGRRLGKLLASLGLVRTSPETEQPAKAVANQPAASNATESRALPGPVARGRKPLTAEEIDKLRKQWRERPASMSEGEFCDTIACVSETTFRKYVPESERWGSSDANSGGALDHST
jgi:hypothetical protein